MKLRQGHITFAGKQDMLDHLEQCATEIRNALARHLLELDRESAKTYLAKYREKHGDAGHAKLVTAVRSERARSTAREK